MAQFFLFSKFVSISVIRVVFVLGAIAFIVPVVAYRLDGPRYGALEEGILPVVTWLGLVVCWRVTLEMYVALIQIAENTTKLVELKESKEP